MNRRKLITGLGAGIFVVGGENFLPFSGVFSPNKPAPGAAYGAEDGANKIIEMAIGAENAPVTVIEYASFTCPYCRKFHIEVYPQLKANYIDTNNVRFILREVYFDRYGLWGSILARCDNNTARFFTIYDQLMHQQASWTKGSPQEIVETLRRIGRAAGLAKEELDSCFNDGAGAKALVDWAAQNLEKDTISGTPSFVIDEKLYSNMNYQDFSRILDEKING